MRNLVGGFGWLFGLGVVALVARYGYISSDNQVNGAILALLFAGLAAGGLFGHAVAVHIWRIHRGWSVLLGFICVACLVLNISNSLGAIAGRDDKTLAERAMVKETRADDRAELKRLTTERENLPKFVVTSAEAVRAAQAAVAAAERTRAAECEKRGPNCRTRETEEQTKRDALAKALTDKATTDHADKLDAELKRLRTRLDTGDAVRNVNPQGAILTKLFRLPDSEADTAATWQQFAMSIMVDLLIMACFIAHEVMGWEARRPKEQSASEFVDRVPAVVLPQMALPPAAKPRLVATAKRPTGSVREFIATAFEVAIGQKVGMTAAYLAYVARCKARERAAVTPEQFFEATDQVCRQNGIPIEVVDGKPQIVNVQLVSQSMSVQPA